MDNYGLHVRTRRSNEPRRPGSDLPEEAMLSITLRELLQTASPALGPLIAVKRHARHMARSGLNDLPAEVHRLIYFASSAAAMVGLGHSITKSDPKSVRIAFAKMAAESYVDDWLRRLFESAGDRFSGL
jgi:hypothetical protein